MEKFMSNEEHNLNSEQKKIGEVSRRDFIKYTAGTAVCFSLGSFNFGCGNSSTTEVAGYPIDATVSTTVTKTIAFEQTFSPAMDPKNLQNVAEYAGYGYGIWSDGPGLDYEKRNDIMAAGYAYPVATSPTLQLLRFFAITDIHITDKESPSQAIYMEVLMGKETSTYSPAMLYSTQVLDAAIQTVNALHKQNRIDFGISLGDACNSTQYNELRWYLDVIDGKVITPSSGAHAGADSIDYQKPFKAAGLSPEIPWYQTIGNHDHFWLGSIPLDTGDLGDLRSTYTSSEVIALGNALANSSKIYDTTPPLYYMGVIDGSTTTGAIIKAGKVGAPGFSTAPTVVPDPDRRSLTKADWVDEFFKTSTSPTGHGFNLVPPGLEKGFACYSFSPKTYIKVIVLDDTQRGDDDSTKIHGHGFLDLARWKWLKAELAAGDAAGQLMIIAAHIPICVTPKNSFMEWFDNSLNPSSIQNAVTLPGLLAELHSHPNLLMWIAGHRHVNVVKAFKSADATHTAANNFWQVETSSLRDFPQQLRTFDIKLNSDYSVSIVTTNVDPAVKEGTPAAVARKYSVAAMQIVNSPKISQDGAPLIVPATQLANGTDPSIHPMPTGSYNAELLVQLSNEMKAKMQTLYPAL
jgi:metallophosphoesterase (TIGR03768 family)